MNEATARGILGGPITATIDVKDGAQGYCQFSHQDGAVRHQLSIVVAVMTDIAKQFPAYRTQCPPEGTPLRAIGNEAVRCSIQTHDEMYAEKVVGRVRDQAFVITVSSSAADDPTMTPQMRREKVELAAELVAGILF